MALGATDREITVFLAEIINGKSQREAYRIARPLSKKWTDKCVDERACTLFNSEKVKKRYAELLAKATAAVEKECVLSFAEKRRILANIAIDPNERKENVIKAIDLDNKMEGLYINRTELTGNNGGPLEFVWAGDNE